MSERLHVIMPTSRPWNLPRLAHYWLVETMPHLFEVRWYVFQQGPEPDQFGVSKINEALLTIKDGWVITANDDTLHDRSLLRRLAEVSSGNPNAVGIVFSERRPDGTILHASADNMKRCFIDGQQVFFRGDFISGQQLDRNQFGEQCDGELIERMFSKCPERFVFIDEVLVNFNSIYHERV